MKLGISSFVTYPEPVEAAVELAKELKLDCVELVLGPFNNSLPSDFSIVRALGLRSKLEAYNLECFLHLSLEDIMPASPLENVRLAAAREIISAVDLAVESGAKIVSFHAGHWFKRYAFGDVKTEQKIHDMGYAQLIKTIKNCMTYAKQKNITLAVENGYDFKGKLHEMFGAGTKMFGVNASALLQINADTSVDFVIDIGKAHDSRLSIKGFIEQMMQHTLYYHVADKDDLHRTVSIAEGNIDFRTLVPIMVRNEKPLIVELHGVEEAKYSINELRRPIYGIR